MLGGRHGWVSRRDGAAGPAGADGAGRRPPGARLRWCVAAWTKIAKRAAARRTTCRSWRKNPGHQPRYPSRSSADRAAVCRPTAELRWRLVMRRIMTLDQRQREVPFVGGRKTRLRVICHGLVHREDARQRIPTQEHVARGFQHALANIHTAVFHLPRESQPHLAHGLRRAHAAHQKSDGAALPASLTKSRSSVATPGASAPPTVDGATSSSPARRHPRRGKGCARTRRPAASPPPRAPAGRPGSVTPVVCSTARLPERQSSRRVALRARVGRTECERSRGGVGGEDGDQNRASSAPHATAARPARRRLEAGAAPVEAGGLKLRGGHRGISGMRNVFYPVYTLEKWEIQPRAFFKPVKGAPRLVDDAPAAMEAEQRLHPPIVHDSRARAALPLGLAAAHGLALSVMARRE